LAKGKKAKKLEYPNVRWRFWRDYVREIRDLLWLGIWRIDLSRDPIDADDIAAASIKTTYGRKVATLRFSARWETFTPEEQRHVVTHELCHLIENGQRAVMKRCSEVFGDQSKLAEELHLEQHEYSVDHFAFVLAHYFPLPECTGPVHRTKRKKAA
jgi:hypothetical protein